MKKTKTLLAVILTALILFSCGKKSVKTSDSGISASEQISRSIRENIDSIKVEMPVQTPQTVEDIDGNVYKTVKIGNQTWITKNLKTTKLNDGTSIELIKNDATWASLSTPGYCWYNNDEASVKGTFGALYNGYTVATGKLCPAGWHVPSDADWTTLIIYLGGENIAGGKLKENSADFWVIPNTGANNESGFTAIPGGLRYHDGIFHDFGFSGYWWSSTEYSESRAYFRYMDYEYSNVFRFNNLKKLGFSVRCLLDY
jgi:uncharacterized protein (TIGR02145 family)